MVCFATSKIASNSGANSPITLKIEGNRRGFIRNIEVLESNNSTELKPWQILDLLAAMLPRYVHSFENIYKVSFETNSPAKYLIVKKIESDIVIKKYRLDRSVSTLWAITLNPAHLRALVYWWRSNRDQYDTPICEWGIWRNEA